jgi:PKD repeat protein
MMAAMTRSCLRVLILAGLVAVAGCDRSSPSPAAPTPAPSPGAGPSASFKLTVDNAGSQDALTGVSEITVDAGASTGSGLKYLVNFGDGATASEPVARHVYDKAGTYRITVTLTDATGRIDTASRDLAVASPLGAWLYSGYIARTRAVEVRTLTLTAQDGATVRGVLSRYGVTDAPVTGRLTPDRRISLTVDRLGETLEGAVPSVLSPNVQTWTLAARGGPVDGETLVLKARPGDPSGPGPDATLGMRFFSFSAPFGIKQISPILFDATTSRGDGLTYFIEFGDREFAQTVTAVHPINEVGEYTARLTAVDRFGRADSETVTYKVGTLVANGYYYWWEGPGVLRIDSQNGTAITGDLFRSGEGPEGRKQFSGTANADGTVRLVLADSGGTLVGTLTLSSTDYDSSLVLTYQGGPHNGETLKFHFRSGY